MGESPGGGANPAAGDANPAVRPMDAVIAASEKRAPEAGCSNKDAGNASESSCIDPDGINGVEAAGDCSIEPIVELVRSCISPDDINRAATEEPKSAGEVFDEVTGSVAVVDPDAIVLEGEATAEGSGRGTRRRT